MLLDKIEEEFVSCDKVNVRLVLFDLRLVVSIARLRMNLG